MTKMASASWNQETKLRLNDKIQLTVTDMGSLVRQVIRGSKSSEMLSQAAKNFASQEQHVHNSMETMKKMDTVRSQLQHQHAAIERSLIHLDEIQDQLATIK
ncbi:BLOC-1-related complex subunit 7-like isoform X1 [Pomacea canaliculata]|uniref:BLOC-1-related complex subunit 7-like isoform X1 n=1 Tax=Pomacea canaliculata TaxID=400727 RepID=UPI000D73162D|nr:BLOC-1-related complex subunit 7-like isoform X1 [Pomacea canaliculata]